MVKSSPLPKPKKQPSLSPITKTERKSRRKYDFSLQTLIAYSHYRQDDAAVMLKVAPITLKRICQRLSYRWPYRSIKARRRREALAAQKKARGVQTKTPSTTQSVPEVLLSLRRDKKVFNCSPTSVSEISSSPSIVRFPTVQFPLQTQLPPQLPPLTTLLKQLETNSRAVPNLNYRRPTINYKSSFYSASFHPTAPKFPIGRLSTLASQCASELYLQSSTDTMVTCPTPL
ncbi:hypothetical protein PHMEG_00024496 [Phytophthora megakarya]|uniref:RWP-RK domain-containing protein n=1 Tax=Phytophthora megakarya TaxID=4795 RepID=A0A225VF40_9STRA|nr:hypothetical protein PHMEG_00024496 [Phytophthora megakarya]